MKYSDKKFILNTAARLDALFWIFSLPLIPMIIAELTIDLPRNINIYFKSYYLVLWFVFTIEFAIKFFSAKKRIEYLKDNPLDLLVIVTPALRVLRVLNALRFPIVLLSDRALSLIGRLGLNFLYYFVFIIVVALGGADLVFYFESQSQLSGIKTFSDALWWTVNYLTSVGSGTYIATTGGRVIGVALMTIGFAVYSVLIASLVSFFMKEYSRTSPEENLLEGLGDQLGMDDIKERLDRIEKKLNER